jgi:hypothetical protein
MTRPKRTSAIIGFLLVAAGLWAAYWWYYKLVPMRHLADPKWRAAHSESARWAEEQKNYTRTGASPDLCFRGDQIGFYGNKQWFLWLDERIRNPQGFRHCGCTEYALALMTNRHVDSWARWTDANRHRSQEEWIKDGFLDYGVTVHLPPAPDDTLALLRLLGRKSWNFLWAGPDGKKTPDSVPSYIHYNAYRWLRDSQFDPIQFATSNTTAAQEPDIATGLLNFSQWHAAYPGRDGTGVLTLLKPTPRDSNFDLPPRIAKPGFLLTVNAIIAAFIISGATLLWRFTKRNAAPQPLAPNTNPETPPSSS